MQAFLTKNALRSPHYSMLGLLTHFVLNTHRLQALIRGGAIVGMHVKTIRGGVLTTF